MVSNLAFHQTQLVPLHNGLQSDYANLKITSDDAYQSCYAAQFSSPTLAAQPVSAADWRLHKGMMVGIFRAPGARIASVGGAYKLLQLNPVVTRSLKAPGLNPCTYDVKTRFQTLLFQMQLVPLYASGFVNNFESCPTMRREYGERCDPTSSAHVAGDCIAALSPSPANVRRYFACVRGCAVNMLNGGAVQVKFSCDP
jgi:hypothetical protein